jgi:hypothetical protein
VPLLGQAKLSSFFGKVENPLTDEGTHLYIVRAMQSLGPSDGQDRFLAMQMLATHTLAMKSLAFAQGKEQTETGREMHLARATQLMRLYIAQMEAWKHHRSTGNQHCTVEHVHVHSGAQAVVGTLNHHRQMVSKSKRLQKKEGADV